MVQVFLIVVLKIKLIIEYSEIYSGIREDECSKLIKDFFKKIRSD